MSNSNDSEKAYYLIKDMHELYKKSTDNMVLTLEKVHREYRRLMYILLSAFVILLGIAGFVTYGKLQITLEKSINDHVERLISSETITKTFDKHTDERRKISFNAEVISRGFNQIAAMEVSSDNVSTFMNEIRIIDDELPWVVKTSADRMLIKQSSSSFLRALPRIKRFLTVNQDIATTEYIYQAILVVIKYYYGGSATVKKKISTVFRPAMVDIEKLYSAENLELAVPNTKESYKEALVELKKLVRDN